MGVKKNNVECVSYFFCTLFTLGGVGLAMAGLLIPYWYKIRFIQGQVEVVVNVGLWQDRVCIGQGGCENKWTSDYDRFDEVSIPSGHLIKWLETVGTAFGILSLFTLVNMWIARKAQPKTKSIAHVLFFAPCMIGAFLCVTGTLVLGSKGDDDLADWAAFLSGAGGAAMFMSGCLACVVCRYDPSYGTLENPVSPRYIS